MVTVGIALFLLGGLVTIVQNVRQANLTQSKLTTLQDEERFAFTVLTDALQAGGYFGDPIGQSSFSFGAAGGFAAGAAFTGSHAAGAAPTVAQDSVSTRFLTTTNYGPILCNGVDTSLGGTAGYTITFSVATSPTLGDQLLCSVNGGAPFPLVNGVHAMTVYYGINRNAPNVDYNVDTYVTADALANVNDLLTISALRVVLCFDNPLYAVGTTQPQYIVVERVIQVMGRAGVHT
jgi:type IV pilus assembly protein PilW